MHKNKNMYTRKLEKMGKGLKGLSKTGPQVVQGMVTYIMTTTVAIQ